MTADNHKQQIEAAASHHTEISVTPKQDYSALPQKPIKLKQGIGGLAGPFKKPIETAHRQLNVDPAVASRRSPPAGKERSTRKSWRLRGVSETAREAARNAAKAEGIALGEWVERSIFVAVAHAHTRDASASAILQALSEIQARLERLEQRPDAWQRFKAYVKTWLG